MKYRAAVVMLLALVACKSKARPKVDPGSAPSGEGTATGSALPSPDAAAVVAADAPAAAAALTITADGIGPIKVTVSDDSDDAIKDHLLTALKPYPELAVDFEVMDTEAGELGYFAVKKGDKEVMQVMRPTPEKKDLELHAQDPMFSTKEGVKPTDKAATLDRVAGVACTVNKDNALGMITCASPSEPKIVYVINAENFKGKGSKKGEPISLEKIADRDIFEIVR